MSWSSFPSTRQAELDQRYAAYRAGRYTLTRDETDQIGLRLASRLQLPQVYAGDWNGMPPGDLASMDWDTYASRTGKADVVAAMRDPRRAELQDLSNTPLTDLLARMNTTEAGAARHRRYYDYAMLGDDGKPLAPTGWPTGMAATCASSRASRASPMTRTSASW